MMSDNRMPTRFPGFDSAKSLDELHAMLDEIQMKNGWAKPTPSMYAEPRQPFVPAHRRCSHARAALRRAGSLVDTRLAERRNLIMANPVPGNDLPTVNSRVAAYQMVQAGETARSHRHMPNAIATFDRTATESCAGAVWSPGLNMANETVVVVEGRDSSQFGDRRSHWERGDIVAVPYGLMPVTRAKKAQCCLASPTAPC